MVAGESTDYDKLEMYLRALAYGSRLELLHMLRSPRAVQDIRLAPRQTHPGESADRAISRQALQAHLDKLNEIGVVVVREAQTEGRRGKEYVVNPQRLYQVMEEFRKIGTISPGGLVSRDATADLGETRLGRPEPGPKLTLVHGLIEGKAFPLRRADLRDGRGWVIGRKSGLHVSLDYDPYVSLENAEVLLEDSRHVLMDLRNSKNGTWLNWTRLEKGDAVPLTPGDVVGVGRSLLVFREA